VENLTGNNAPALPQYHHNIPVQADGSGGSQRLQDPPDRAKRGGNRPRGVLSVLT
jgi:hypothetical protein